MGLAVSGARSASDVLHVVFLLRSFGFPHGMASTNRVRLLARALIEQGDDVRIMCTRASESPGVVLNRAASGVADGVPFLYTTGSTVRGESFMVRRAREARGYLTALCELARLRRTGQLDCAYLPSVPYGWRLGVWALSRVLSRLGVAVAIELNERPWSAARLPAPFDRLASQLAGVDGVVAISAPLADWARAEGHRIGRSVPVLELPVVVDVGEQQPTIDAQVPTTLVYSASSGYDAALRYILQAMRTVWEAHPECRLVVTGVEAARVLRLAAEEGHPGAADEGRLVPTGYVDRPQLMALQRRASALLIPLFDDEADRVRFPTKVGEYLASGRPVITTSVGEIVRYLRDGESAYVRPPGDAAAYASGILDVLEHPASATAVGQAGRRVAEEGFHYAHFGPGLHAFLSSICGAIARQGGLRR